MRLSKIMTPPRIAALACGALAFLGGIKVLKMSEDSVVMLIILAGMWLYMELQQRQLVRHRNALMWFLDHVYQPESRQKATKAELPQELEDMVNKD